MECDVRLRYCSQYSRSLDPHSKLFRSNANEVHVTILNCYSLAVSCQSLVWSVFKFCDGLVFLSSRFRVIFISDPSYSEEIRYVSCRRLGIPSEPVWKGSESPTGVRAQDRPSRSENRSTPRKDCASANFFTTNFTLTVLELNPALRGARPLTNLKNGKLIMTSN